MKELSPIGLTVYGRLEHTKLAVEALKRNKLAEKSCLYIFSDGARKGEEEKVKRMREYLETISGFKEVTIIKRRENSRIKNNRGGQKYLLNKFGKMIWMAEDIVTAAGFLQFINDALNYYENDKRILSITGYTPPIDIVTSRDAFVLERYNAWGMGIWKEQYDKICRIPQDYAIKIDKAKLALNGKDIFQMIHMDAIGKINAFDVRAMYLQHLQGFLTVYPQKSLVQNIGHDGSGVHCGINNKFHHDQLWDKVSDFRFVKNIQVDEEIREVNYKFRDDSLKIKIQNQIKTLVKKIGVLQLIKTINNSVK